MPAKLKTADATDLAEPEYDVALSFAGEQRGYVEDVAERLRARGVSVFYDRYEEAELWGENLHDRLDDIYRKRARYVVLFASAEYATKVWTNHERRSAQARALESRRAYVLPARFDDTEIPGMLPTVGYIDLRKIDISAFVDLVERKLDSSRADTPVHIKTLLHAAYDRLDYLHQRPEAAADVGITWPWSALNEATGGLLPGELAVFSGRAGVGKTAVALNVAAHLGIHRRSQVVYLSIAERAERLVQRLLSIASGIPTSRLTTGQLHELDFVALAPAMNSLADSTIAVADYPISTTLDVETLVRRSTTADRDATVIVDYLELLAAAPVETVSSVVRHLKGIARRSNVAIVALSTAIDVGTSLSDFIDADAVVEMNRGEDDGSGLLTLDVRKHRSGHGGSARLLIAWATGIAVETTLERAPFSFSNNNTPLSIRLSTSEDDGTPFEDYLADRHGLDGRIAAIMILQWGHLRDDLGRPPSFEQYQAQWPARIGSFAPSDEYAAFHRIFPEEDDPDRIWHLLWEGTKQAPSGELMEIMRVRVIDT